MYEMRIYNERGMLKTTIKRETLEECRDLWECFPMYSKPTVWKKDEEKQCYVRVEGF